MEKDLISAEVEEYGSNRIPTAAYAQAKHDAAKNDALQFRDACWALENELVEETNRRCISEAERDALRDALRCVDEDKMEELNHHMSEQRDYFLERERIALVTIRGLRLKVKECERVREQERRKAECEMAAVRAHLAECKRNFGKEILKLTQEVEILKNYLDAAQQGMDDD